MYSWGVAIVLAMGQTVMAGYKLLCRLTLVCILIVAEVGFCRNLSKHFQLCQTTNVMQLIVINEFTRILMTFVIRDAMILTKSWSGIWYTE